MITYLLTHWQGKQSLGWSLWINLIGVRVLIFSAQTYWLSTSGVAPALPPPLVYGIVLLAHGVVLLWQIVGVIRACDHHYAEHTSMATVWGTQIVAIVLFLLSAIYSLEAVQANLQSKNSNGDAVFEQIRRNHAAQYQLTTTGSGCTLQIDGTLALGITKAVRQLLVQNDKLHTVVLNSNGGNVYEGRGLAKLFSENQLNTHVNDQCASACTLAFIGGKNRTATSTARFGFHQYRLEADYDIIAADVKKEQTRDIALFLQSGVSELLVEQLYKQSASSIWWPDIAELLAAGFVSINDAEPLIPGACTH